MKPEWNPGCILIRKPSHFMPGAINLPATYVIVNIRDDGMVEYKEYMESFSMIFVTTLDNLKERFILCPKQQSELKFKRELEDLLNGS